MPARTIPPLLAGLALGAFAVSTAWAQALPPTFGSVPSFTWTDPSGLPRWDGSFARMSTGFAVISSKRFGTVAGPTVGFEGGRLWQEGALVYGVVGGFDYMAPFGPGTNPGVGGIAYTRDFAGGVQFKAGALVADNLLVYAKVGAAAINETLRFGPTAVSAPFSRTDIAVRPDARVGAEWAITDRLSVGVEVGVTGRDLR